MLGMASVLEALTGYSLGYSGFFYPLPNGLRDASGFRDA